VQTLTLVLEAAVAALAIGVAVGAPLVGMRLHRRDPRPTLTPAPAAARVATRDELPVAA
jgi:uncharacterized protein YqfA (UPF0365 family)